MNTAHKSAGELFKEKDEESVQWVRKFHAKKAMIVCRNSFIRKFTLEQFLRVFLISSHTFIL